MNRDISLLIKFDAEGGVAFYPVLHHDGDEFVLATKLRRLVCLLIENPSAIACAAGHHANPAGKHRR